MFNQSFENFVLTIIEKQESLEYEFEARKSGTWSNLRYPILLIIATLFIFLFVTQEDVFKDIMGWLAALLATIPLISRLIIGFAGFRFGKNRCDAGPFSAGQGHQERRASQATRRLGETARDQTLLQARESRRLPRADARAGTYSPG